MKKYTLLFIAIVVLGAGAYYSELAFLSYSNSPAPTTATTLATTTAAQGDTLQSQGVTLAAPNAKSTKPRGIVFTLSASGKSYNGEVKEGDTVLGAMNALASSTDFRFTSKNFSGMGAFVESINGKKNAGGFYWILYVNGKASDLGVSQAKIRSGDTIEWKYEKGY